VEVGSSTIIRRHPEVIDTDLQGEVVLMSLATGLSYTFDRHGSQIWRFLEKSQSLESLVSQVCEFYEVPDRDKCRSDLHQFLLQLHDSELVTVEN
jgi:hypothetical protein